MHHEIKISGRAIKKGVPGDEIHLANIKTDGNSNLQRGTVC